VITAAPPVSSRVSRLLSWLERVKVLKYAPGNRPLDPAG